MSIRYWYGIIESSNFDYPSSIHSPLPSILSSPSSNLIYPTPNFMFSFLLPASSVKSANLTQNVLKIVEYRTKWPQSPCSCTAFSFFQVCWVVSCSWDKFYCWVLSPGLSQVKLSYVIESKFLLLWVVGVGRWVEKWRLKLNLKLRLTSAKDRDHRGYFLLV